MPYKIVHRPCKQSDGDAGEWVVVRRDIGKQVSCHTSKAKAQGSISARHINEEDLEEIVEAVLRRLMEGSFAP